MRKPLRQLTRLLPAALLAAALALSAAGGVLAQAATPDARRELAPTGALRLALLETNRSIATRDPASGELRGPGVDLGRELARRLGVPLEPVGYLAAAQALDALRAGRADATILGIDPARAAEFDFAPPYLLDDMTYIVPAASPIRTAADADRPGVRIAAAPGSVYHLVLQRELRRAELVTLDRAQVWAALEAGTVHAHAFGRSGLLEDAAQRPGLRVVEGRFGVVELAVMLPRGRPAALAFVSQVVDEAKASGFVQRSVEAAGLRGVQVPPAWVPGMPATGAGGPGAAAAAPLAPTAAALLLLGVGAAALGRRCARSTTRLP